MTKIIWFSRHPMTADQRAALEGKLGPVEIEQVNKTVASAAEILDPSADAYAVVMSVELMAELRALTDKPIYFATSERVRTTDPDGQPAFEFKHKAWLGVARLELEEL